MMYISCGAYGYISNKRFWCYYLVFCRKIIYFNDSQTSRVTGDIINSMGFFFWQGNGRVFSSKADGFSDCPLYRAYIVRLV